MRYDHNTRQVEKLGVAKKVNYEDLALVEFLDNRRKRMFKDLKERDVEYMSKEEVADAI